MRFTPEEFLLLMLSVCGSFVSVLMSPFRSIRQSVAQFAAGVLAGFVFTPPILKYFEIDPLYGGAIGAIFGLVGNGLIRMLVEASNDPEKAKGFAKLVLDMLSVFNINIGQKQKDRDDDRRDPR